MCRSASLLLAVVASSACATAAPPLAGGSPPTAVARHEAGTRRASALVAEHEWRATPAGPTALEALERLRPGFVRVLQAGERWPALPAVFVDGVYAGSLEVLQSLPAAAVRRVRLIRPIEARHRYGEVRARGGAVEVTLRPPS